MTPLSIEWLNFNPQRENNTFEGHHRVPFQVQNK